MPFIFLNIENLTINSPYYTLIDCTDNDDGSECIVRYGDKNIVINEYILLLRLS